MSGSPAGNRGETTPHTIALAGTSRLGPQWTIHSGILNSGDTTPRHPSKAGTVDDPHLGHHHHDMPDWGRVLWERYWLLQAQTDRHAAQIDRHTATLQHLKEKIMATQADLDAITAELGTALANIQAEIAALQAANPALDLSALQAAADALAAVAPPADVPPSA